MMTKSEHWAVTPDGQKVSRVSIGNKKLHANVITYGAILQDLRLSNWSYSLVLGYQNFAPYVHNRGMVGAIVGRYANRISKGMAVIGGQTHYFDKNQDGVHTLHGGQGHSGTRLWTIKDLGRDFVVLSDVIPADHMGFPGNLQVDACYHVSDMALDITIKAKTDALTLCNFTNHSYFNLNAYDRLQAHHLCVNADHYIDVDKAGIPIGAPSTVAGTEFDFRLKKPLTAHNQVQMIDHNFCLSDKRRDITEVGTLFGESISMKVETTEPGLQVYTGANLSSAGDNDAPLRPINAYSGIALEAQIWPDAPNNSKFPSALLGIDEIYSHHTRYSFLT